MSIRAVLQGVHISRSPQTYLFHSLSLLDRAPIPLNHSSFSFSRAEQRAHDHLSNVPLYQSPNIRNAGRQLPVFLLYCEWVDQIAPNLIVTGRQFYLQYMLHSQMLLHHSLGLPVPVFRRTLVGRQQHRFQPELLVWVTNVVELDYESFFPRSFVLPR